MVHSLYENTYVNKVCSFNSNMHESCQSKKTGGGNLDLELW